MPPKAKKYKYKDLMIAKGVLEPCPTANCKEDNRTAYHFGFDTIENIKNFVPGHKKATLRMNDQGDIKNCLYCGLSMFKTINGAKVRWSQMEGKHKEMLGYTHILEGKLNKDLGVVTSGGGQHYTFFEYEEVELRNHFKVLTPL